MAVELGLILLESVVGVIKSSSDNRDLSYIREQVERVANVVVDVRELLSEVHAGMVAQDDPEVARFARARSVARARLHAEWDASLLDFATELLAAVLDDGLVAVRLSVDAVVVDDDAPYGFRRCTFKATVLASRTVSQNADELAHFLALLLAFNNFGSIPHAQAPVVVVRLARGESANPRQLDRIKHRLGVRLALLSSCALGWAENILGSLAMDNHLLCDQGRGILKYVIDWEFSDATVNAIGDRMRLAVFRNRVEDALKDALRERVESVRVFIFSESCWRSDLDISHVKALGTNIRTFYDDNNVKYLEIKGPLDEWDLVMLKRAVFLELSASILVFRFVTLPGLAELIGMSKEITDLFPGLTTDRERIMFVDAKTTTTTTTTTVTTTCSEFGKVRRSVQTIARSLRLLEPRTQSDIQFEIYDPKNTAREVSSRARNKSSLLCTLYKGPSRPCLELIVRVLNREVKEEDAHAESRRVVEFLIKLRSFVSSKVSVDTCGESSPGIIEVLRDDSSGFNWRSDVHAFPETSKFKGYVDFNEASQVRVLVKIFLNEKWSQDLGLPDIKFWSRKWELMKDIEELVHNGRFFLSVTGEQVRPAKNRPSVVSGLNVKILGGGMEEFLLGKIISCCMQAVKGDGEAGYQDVVRALVTLMPKLKEAVKSVPGSEKVFSKSSFNSTGSVRRKLSRQRQRRVNTAL